MHKPVAVIDDDCAVLDSIRMLLEGHGLTVQCHISAETFLSDEARPVCIVSDVRMPGMSGLELVGELKKRGDDCPIILLTGHGDIEMAVQAIKAGALDFIEKPFDPERLVGAVRNAISTANKQSAQTDTLRGMRERHASLSDRQKETMLFLVQGMANKEIAIRLGISPRTVEIHRTWVMNKMAAKTLADLVRMAMTLELSQLAVK